MQLRTSKQFEEILTTLFKTYIQLEIACYRPEIENLHFLCTSFIMEALCKFIDEHKKLKEEKEEWAARQELTNFIHFLISQKDGYINQHIREELLTLQKNKGDEDYIRKYIQFYRYWMLNTSSKSFEKISFINQHLCQINPIFQEFKNKIKLSTLSNSAHTIYRNGTINGLFHYNKQLTQNKNIQIEKDKEKDMQLLEELQKSKDKYFNTFIDDEWLKILQQIEKSIKCTYETQFTINELSNIQQIINSKSLPYQIANYAKSTINKIQSQQRLKQNEIVDSSLIPSKSYWQMTKFKLQHDQKLIECVLNQKNALVGAKLADLANLISFLTIGKFGNVMVAGCFDGNLLIYELTENFIMDGVSKIELNSRRQSSSKLLSNPSFEMQIHEGPITAISLLYDEFYMVSVSIELTIKLSCLRSRQPLLSFRGHLQTIWHISFAPAGYWFATASSDGTALLWATDQNNCQRIFGPVADQVKLVEFVPSAEYIVTAEENRAFRLWNIEKAECVYLNYLESNITSMNISLTGQYLALGCADGQILMYYLPTMKKLKDKIYLQRMDMHSANSRDYIRSVSISEDEQVVLGCNSSRIGFFNISNLMKQTSEDVFVGLYTSLQQMEYQKNNWCKNAIPIELIEIPDYLQIAMFMPQGFGLYISK